MVNGNGHHGVVGVAAHYLRTIALRGRMTKCLTLPQTTAPALV